jgi:hypothetical protein
MDVDKKLDAFMREFAEFRSSYQRDQMKDAETLGMISRELSDLNSAVRGNERNDQPGLIGRMREQEKKHAELELEVRNVRKQQYKIQVWAMSLTTFINVAWIGLKELFHR